MRYGQLIDIFIEKSYAKCGGKIIPRLFLKNQNQAYLWFNSVKFYTICFNHMPSWRLSKYIETKAADHLLLPHLIFLKKKRRVRELVYLPDFLHDIWRKIFLLLYSITWPNLIASLFLLREILGNICIVIVF